MNQQNANVKANAKKASERCLKLVKGLTCQTTQDRRILANYEGTISKLLERLNEAEHQAEVDEIYGLIGDLSDKISQTNQDTKKMTVRIVMTALIVGGIIAKSCIDRRKS